MSSIKKYIFGVRVYINTPSSSIPTDTNVGWYNTSSTTGELRLIQTSITTASPYTVGLLASIGKLGNAAVFRNGGNTAQIPTTDISITSVDLTSLQSFWANLSLKGVSLMGCKVVIIEFDASTSPATETIIYTGTVSEAPTFDQVNYKFTIENTYYKRKVNLGTVIDNDPVNGNYKNADSDLVGKTVPITIGIINEAKAQQTANIVVNFKFDSYYTLVPNNQIYFPVYDFPSALSVTIALGTKLTAVLKTLGTILSTMPYYMHVTEGAGKGQYRKITGVTGVPSVGVPVLTFTISDYFETQIISYLSAIPAPTNMSYVEIVYIPEEFTLDVWPVRKFVDSATWAEQTTPEPTVYDNQSVSKGTITIITLGQETDVTIPVSEQTPQFIPIPSYAYKAGIGYRTIVVDPLHTVDNPEDLNSHTVLQLKSANLTQGIRSIKSDYTISHDYDEVSEVSGRYWQNGTVASPSFQKSGILMTPIWSATVAAMCDKDPTTYTGDTAIMNFDGVKIYTNLQYITGVEISLLPNLPEGFTFDKMFVGFKIKSSVTPSNTLHAPTLYTADLQVRWNKFMGTAIECTNSQYTNKYYDYNETSTMANIPDDYWGTSTNNFDFYYTPASGATIYPYISGYQNFEVSGISSVADYALINKIGIILNRTITPHSAFVGTLTYETDFYEVCLIFQKKISVKDNIYVPVSGRIVNSTWSGRKQSANPITTPLEAIEHILRLQNWSEEGATVNFGQAYSPQALINTTSTEGGFEYDGVKSKFVSATNTCSQPIARQILDINDAWSDKLLKELCQQFFLCSFQNNLGKECINFVGVAQTTPSVNLTYADILDGTIGELQEQHIADIFCEPTIYYDYNYASGKYDSCFGITNSNAATFDPSYITGYKNLGTAAQTEASQMWAMSHLLWEKYGVVNKPPSFLTECKWLRSNCPPVIDPTTGLNTADTSLAARQYLMTWYNWMGAYWKQGIGATFSPKRWVPFSVGYDLAMTLGAAHTPWFPSMHFTLNTPYETAGQTVNCIIEKIEYDIDYGKADITAIIFDLPELIDLYIQDDYNSHASVGWEDWQDSVTTVNYDIQDV